MDIQQQKQFKILLIGDVCVDEYQYGSVERISPEAPVPVLKFTRNETKPGMAYNVLENLKRFNVEIKDFYGAPSRKVRLIDERSGQHIVRIDHDTISSELRISKTEYSNIDCIIISDYGKGFVSYDTIEGILCHFDGPVFIDTKKPDLARFSRKNCWVKINELEFNSRESTNENLIVTLGSKGALYEGELFPAPKVDVVDVCGAGDTFLATLSYYYLLTKNIDEAIKKAIVAASITVQHMGVYAPTIEEIENAS